MTFTRHELVEKLMTLDHRFSRTLPEYEQRKTWQAEHHTLIESQGVTEVAVKIRVYELAKELGTDNKEMVRIIRALGLEVKNYMSSMLDTEADQVRRHVLGGGGTASAPPGISRRVDDDGPTSVAGITTETSAPALSRPRRGYTSDNSGDDPLEDLARPGNAESGHTRLWPPWDSLLAGARSSNPHERRTVVLDACEVLRRTLKELRIPGSSMVDLLLAAPEHIDLTAKELASAIRSNQRRNGVAHDSEQLNSTHTEEVVRAFFSIAQAVKRARANR